jgi:hypothetical protein
MAAYNGGIINARRRIGMRGAAAALAAKSAGIGGGVSARHGKWQRYPRGKIEEENQ